jgi:hypothetical protein
MQLFLLAGIVLVTWAKWRWPNTSPLLIEASMVRVCVAIALLICLPFTTLSALLGLRKRVGAGRAPGQPRQVFTVDLLALGVCGLSAVMLALLAFAAPPFID